MNVMLKVNPTIYIYKARCPSFFPSLSFAIDSEKRQSLSVTKSCFLDLPNNLNEGRKCSSLTLTCFMWTHILIYYTFLSEISSTFQSDLHRDHGFTESESLFINCQEERNKSQSQLHCFPWLLSTKFQIN